MPHPKDVHVSDINELYQQVILEHNRKPRNFGKLVACSHSAEGFNPLCGDHLWVYLQVSSDKKIEKIQFEGTGCAISKASASMMTVALTGKSIDDAKLMIDEFQGLLKGEIKPGEPGSTLGRLTIFSGIWKFPARVKCAVLSWHAVKGALSKQQVVSTE